MDTGAIVDTKLSILLLLLGFVPRGLMGGREEVEETEEMEEEEDAEEEEEEEEDAAVCLGEGVC